MGLSPASISLLANLKFERQKDIGAMLLYYELHHIISLENGDIKVLSWNHPMLKESDKILLQSLLNHEEINISLFETQVVSENISEGFIKYRSFYRKNGKMNYLFLLFYILFFILLLFLCYLWSFVFLFLFKIVYYKNESKLKRTLKGEIITEQIWALKNFLHDFSSISEVHKEQLVLWEDFLVYAVVLEENTVILKEIANCFHYDLTKTGMLLDNYKLQK